MKKAFLKISCCTLAAAFSLFIVFPFLSCNQNKTDVKHDTIVVHDTVIKHDTVRVPVNNPNNNCNDNPNPSNNQNNYNYNNNNQNHPVARKPNIYIYPGKDISLDVSISFPKGGSVINSIPAYNDGWKIKVDAKGKIDNTYDYLFYESTQPDNWQYRSGWVVNKDSLKSFFQENMQDYGFASNEIKDFIDYWIPKLNAYDYYEVCPQSKVIIDNEVMVNYSSKPDNILRLFYTIKGTNVRTTLFSPEVKNNFKREGYYIAEWGVVLK